jgi:hypothetical protein
MNSSGNTRQHLRQYDYDEIRRKYTYKSKSLSIVQYELETDDDEPLITTHIHAYGWIGGRYNRIVMQHDNLPLLHIQWTTIETSEMLEVAARSQPGICDICGGDMRVGSHGIRRDVDYYVCDTDEEDRAHAYDLFAE